MPNVELTEIEIAHLQVMCGTALGELDVSIRRANLQGIGVLSSYALARADIERIVEKLRAALAEANR